MLTTAAIHIVPRAPTPAVQGQARRLGGTRVLLVADAPAASEVESVLERAGAEVTLVSTLTDARAQLHERAFDAAVASTRVSMQLPIAAARRGQSARPAHAPVTAIDEAVQTLAARVRLTPRERTVLRLIALGQRYRDIGFTLGISPRTVKMHATNVRHKLGVGRRHELLRELFGDGTCR
jgi:DNA-binding CsgD family transcriptional regulator